VIRRAAIVLGGFGLLLVGAALLVLPGDADIVAAAAELGK